jgi:DNA-binding CsgD family transcriptional regulator
MRSPPFAPLAFAAQLVRAHDPASLYHAIEVGLGPLFRHHALIASFDWTGGAQSLWSSRPQLAYIPERLASAYDIAPGIPWARERPSINVFTMSDVVAEEDLDGHPYYREFMEPDGWRYGLSLIVRHRADVAGFVAILRRPEQRDFSALDRTRAKLLHPLIAAAWERLAKHSRDETAQRAQEALLSTLPLPVLIYSPRTRRVLFHNRASVDAVAHWRGEAARKRPRTVTARWLPPEIVAACNDVPRRGADVQYERGGMRARLRRMDPRGHFESDVVLIVIEGESGVHAGQSSAWLELARDLSGAEQDVARLAAKGYNNVEIGKHLGKSGLTVKKQLEAVFSKTGVANRAQLTAVVAGFRRTASREPRSPRSRT